MNYYYGFINPKLFMSTYLHISFPSLIVLKKIKNCFAKPPANTVFCILAEHRLCVYKYIIRYAEILGKANIMPKTTLTLINVSRA